MTVIYRLVKASRADDAISGEGARLYGGRWNPPGSPVVYASESRALAVLESFVHLTLEARFMRFLLYEIKLPTRARVQRYADLGSSHQPLPRESTQKAGRAWLADNAALALVVPSVLIAQEFNYVLNIRHAQFARLEISSPENFSFDDRLWRNSHRR